MIARATLATISTSTSIGIVYLVVVVLIAIYIVIYIVIVFEILFVIVELLGLTTFEFVSD